MPRPIRSAYDQTTLDWDRLRRYAKRVATETRLQPSPAIQYTYSVRQNVKHTEQRPGGFLGLGKPRQVHVTTSQWVDKKVTALGEHWVLNHRTWHRVDTTSPSKGTTLEESTHEGIYLVLLPAGALKTVVVSTTTVLHFGDPRTTGLVQSEAHHSSRDPDEEDICLLDFETHLRDSHQRHGTTQIHTWTDRVAGNRLIRHAKGVGVNLALKAILEGGKSGRG